MRSAASGLDHAFHPRQMPSGMVIQRPESRQAFANNKSPAAPPALCQVRKAPLAQLPTSPAAHADTHPCLSPPPPSTTALRSGGSWAVRGRRRLLVNAHGGARSQRRHRGRAGCHSPDVRGRTAAGGDRAQPAAAGGAREVRRGARGLERRRAERAQLRGRRVLQQGHCVKEHDRRGRRSARVVACPPRLTLLAAAVVELRLAAGNRCWGSHVVSPIQHSYKTL